MNTKKDANKKKMDQIKKTYKAPSLTIFGNVAKLTASTGSANGDAGQTMMI